MPSSTFSAGSLRHVIRIEKPSATLDAAGRPSGWETFADNVPAEVQDQSGRETYQVGRFLGQVTHVVRMRYMQGVTGNMRVIWDARVLEVQYPLNPDGKRIEHRLVCVESNA
jgi:SPP1 family predicted phage head-tail adaptor